MACRTTALPSGLRARETARQNRAAVHWPSVNRGTSSTVRLRGRARHECRRNPPTTHATLSGSTAAAPIPGGSSRTMGAVASHFSSATNRSPFQTVIVASSIGASGEISASNEGRRSGSIAPPFCCSRNRLRAARPKLMPPGTRLHPGQKHAGRQRQIRCRRGRNRASCRPPGPRVCDAGHRIQDLRHSTSRDENGCWRHPRLR